jgi:hypothetical protein
MLHNTHVWAHATLGELRYLGGNFYNGSMDSTEEPPLTGDGALDEALAKVAALGETPLVEHVDILKEAHQALVGFLNSHSDAS